jgi:putative aminophosphonate oxidoreductase
MGESVTGYWLKQALGGAPLETEALEGDARADVAILGGGFTGLWTALRLKALEPALDVAVVEKNFCGSGASGRNGGFCMTWASKIHTLVKLCGAQEGLRLDRATDEAVGAIGAFCNEYGIDAEFRQDGWLWTASNPAQLDAWMPCLDQLERLGANPFQILDAEEAARRGGAPVIQAGVYEPTVASLQPGRLALGLRRVALEKGVRIYERSPVTRIERGPRPRLETARGSLVSDKLVLALNAWAAELREFRLTLLPVAADLLITDPLPAALEGSGLSSGLAVSDSRSLVHYYRSTPDGRIAFGKASGMFFYGGQVGERAEGTSPYQPRMEESFRRFVGGLGDFTIAESWRGPVTRTQSGLPFFGRLEKHPNIVYGHGYCGNGVGPSYTGAKFLASLALDRDDEWASSPLAQGATGRRFPPEPLRYVGAHLVRDAAWRIESAQDEGRRPGLVDKALARFAPEGLVRTDN